MQLLVILRNVIKEAEDGPGFGGTAHGLFRLPSHKRRGSWIWVWENCIQFYPASFPRAKGILDLGLGGLHVVLSGYLPKSEGGPKLS